MVLNVPPYSGKLIFEVSSAAVDGRLAKLTMPACCRSGSYTLPNDEAESTNASTAELEMAWRAQVAAWLGSLLSLHVVNASGWPSTPPAALIAATAALSPARLSGPVRGFVWT